MIFEAFQNPTEPSSKPPMITPSAEAALCPLHASRLNLFTLEKKIETKRTLPRGGGDGTELGQPRSLTITQIELMDLQFSIRTERSIHSSSQGSSDEAGRLAGRRCPSNCGNLVNFFCQHASGADNTGIPGCDLIVPRWPLPPSNLSKN